MSETPEPTPRGRPSRHWGRSLLLVVGPALLALVLASGTAWWMVTTAPGLRAVATLANLLLPGLSIRGVDGTARDGFNIASLAIWGERWSVRIEEVSIVPRHWSASSREIDVEVAAARKVAIDWVSGGPPSAPPESIGVPFGLVIRQGRVESLTLGARDATPQEFRDINLVGRIDERTIEIDRIQGEFERTRIEAHGRIDATAPFATALLAKLATTVQDRSISATADASGSLERLHVTLTGDDAAARAHVDATLRLFAAVPVESLDARIDALDPSLWLEGVQSMQLTIRTTLSPTPRSDGRWGVAGPFAVENALAGPIDRNRLPVRSARGSIAWDDETLTFNVERAEGLRGSAEGSVTWSAARGVVAQARFSGIDAATLHGGSVASDLSGTLDYSLHDGEQRFSGSARNARGLPLSADFEASLRQNVIEIAQARLRLGEGRAEARGRIELVGARSVRLNGTFGALDLAQIARGVDTRLDGSFEVDGRLDPQPTGRARFALADSRVAGRPISGQGRLELANRRFDADVDVRSGEARLTASGGMGSDRELRIELSVPDIATLLPDLAGRVDAQLTLAGEIDAVRVNGTAAASELRFPGGHGVARASATFLGGMQPNEPLAVTLDMTGHSGPGGPERSLASASLVGRGTTAAAQFELSGKTGTAQALRLAANGGWRDGAWRGVLQLAEAGAPLDLKLIQPTPVALGLTELKFGPAEFQLLGTHFSEFELVRAEELWRTTGRFDGLQPQALDAQARAPRRVVRTGAGDRVPLTLAGRWELSFRDSVTGIAVIERTGGDLYSGIDALNPIGISDVGAALNVLSNRLTGNVYVRGRALGSIDAAVDAFIDPALPGGRVLAQDRPLRIVLDASLPDLSWIGPLIGDNVQFSGNGSIHSTIAGTPADPTSIGTMRGDALRLAWVDQAVRLENGRLDAELDDGVLVINELIFSGTPRVAPGDRRALEGLVSDRPFDVKAVGRIALRSLTGSIGVKATQLPILQRADRWMVVSGDAGITLRPDRADLYAKLAVDGAYINFNTLRGGRALPNDVVVRRPGEEVKPSERAPVDVTLDVQGDLGPRFYIEGAGLDARLAGAINVSGRPSQLRGEGSVRTVDGAYAGYGQRLQIQRGIVTFQGPMDNPALNVLAVRAGLPVEVGVALSGTAQRPIVRLYSDPSMSDTEKLNWLVLGRPPGANDGNDRAMLSAAASALFAGQIDSASSSLMRSLGVDQITLQPGQSGASLLPRETVAGRLRSSGVSSSNSAAADFVAVGKRINDDLYLSFEQALSGAEYFVALQYRLTRQLSVIARAGSTNALDLVYSLAFD